LPSPDYGSGADGNLSIDPGSTTTYNINTVDNWPGSPSFAPGANYSVTTLASAGDISITTSAAPNGITAGNCSGAGLGDEILIINLKGSGNDYYNVGQYENHRVSDITSNTITLCNALTNSYDGTSQKIMVQRVPNWANIIIGANANLTSNAWDGSLGGVLFFRASGTVSISGTIDMNQKGYSGGISATNGPESRLGYVAVGGGGGGGGGGGHGDICTGGSGADGAANGGSSCGSSNVGGSGSIGGGGGGMGGGWRGPDGGGGGGNGNTGGTGGNGGSSTGGSGSNGGGGGAGGAGRDSGGGGAGGSAYDPTQNHSSKNGSRIMFGGGSTQGAGGGGGGGSGDYRNSTGGSGGSKTGTGGTRGTDTGSNNASSGTNGGGGNPGGGIIYISASSISVSGAISANGGSGGSGGSGGGGSTTNTNWNSGGGGGGGGSGGSGGSGGLIYLQTDAATLGNNLITSNGGSGGNGGNGGAGGYNGGTGGSGATGHTGNDGKIIISAPSYTGSTSPTFFSLEPYIGPQIEGSAAMNITTGILQSDANTVGLWRLDETGGTGAYLKDSSGNGNHGTPTGTTLVEGISNKARSFNGSSDFITNTNVNNSTVFTIESWIRPTTIGSVLAIAGQRNSTNNTWAFFVRPTGQLGLTLNSIADYASTNAGVTANTWQHVAAVVNGTSLTLYRNGQSVYTTTMGGTAVTGTASFGIGSQNGDGASNPFSGDIDEVRVSSVARSAEEIMEGYRMGRDHRIARTITAYRSIHCYPYPLLVCQRRPRLTPRI
jgi:hypothetical protein